MVISSAMTHHCATVTYTINKSVFSATFLTIIVHSMYISNVHIEERITLS